MADPTAATKALNTQILDPLYNRIQQLEKQVVVQTTIKTGATLADTFPVTLPTPPFPVQAMWVGNSWNETDDEPGQTTNAPSWRVRPDGRLTLEWLNLGKTSKTYSVTLVMSG
jgi:hypothetical protein